MNSWFIFRLGSRNPVAIVTDVTYRQAWKWLRTCYAPHVHSSCFRIERHE
jgi:hypothetical protein